MKNNLLFSTNNLIFLLFVIIISVGVFNLSAYYDAFELIHDFITKYEKLNFDELIILLFTWFILLFIFVVKKQSVIKKQNKELAKIRINLQENLTKKDQLFSIIGHDLKNPFNSILGFSDLLLKRHETLDPALQKKMISLIHKSSKNTLELLNNLLDWGKTQNSETIVDKKEINLFEIIQSELAFFQIFSDSKQIHIINTVSEETLAYADYQMIKTVIRNILSNAIKFSHMDSSITISSSYKSNYALVIISDHGVGLSPHQTDQLFNQSGISTIGTNNEHGTGLGLYISKKLIEKTDGKISVTSELGKGTQFILEIPTFKNKKSILSNDNK